MNKFTHGKAVTGIRKSPSRTPERGRDRAARDVRDIRDVVPVRSVDQKEERKDPEGSAEISC